MADSPAFEIADPPTTPAARPSSHGIALLSPLVVLLIAGFLLRLGLWNWFQHLPIQIFDEKDYSLLAKNLVEHGEFAYEPGTPISLRPPLFPVMVAGIYALCGVENFQAVRLVQAVLSLLNVLVLYGLGREVASRRTALWLAGIFCFYPSFLGFNNLLLTETLFTLLLSSFCYMMVLAYRRQKTSYLLAAGLVLGLATLTRSILWLSPPLLGLFLLATWQASLPRRLLAVMALCIPFACVLAPWTVRNSRLEQTFVAVDTMGGRNFLMGNYQHTLPYRSWDTISLPDEQSWFREIVESYPPEAYSTQGKRDKLALQKGLDFVVEHPWLTLQRDLIKFFDFWGLERELVAGAGRGYFGAVSSFELGLMAVIIFGSYVAALFLGIFGLFLAPLADRRMHLLLFFVVLYTCGLHTLVFAHSRYHLPVMPVLFLFAANALTSRLGVWRQWRRPAFWLAAGLCAFIAVGWFWGLAAGDWVRFQQLIIEAA